MKIEILDNETKTISTWEFIVNSEKFIDLSLDGMYMDTLHDLGKISSHDSLKSKVENLVKSWNVQYTVTN